MLVDKYGSRPLYYSIAANEFAFGSEIKFILSLIRERPAVNWAAIGQYLTFRFCQDNNTFYENINIAYPGTIIRIDYNSQKLKISQKKYWGFPEIKINYRKSINHCVEEGVDIFKTFFSHFGESLTNKKTIIPLSGGYDSRTLVAGVINYSSKKNLDTVTTLHPSGPQEKVIAQQVADSLQVKNIYVNRGPNIYQKYYLEKAFLSDYQVQEHLWVMPMLRVISNYDTYIDGIAGDILFRATRIRPIHIQNIDDSLYLSKLIKSQFGFDYDWLNNYIETPIWNKIKYTPMWVKNAIDEIPITENRMSFFLMLQRIRNCISLCPNSIISIVGKEISQSFFDDNLVHFALSLPHRYKFDNIYRMIQDKLFPQLRRIESVSDPNPEHLKKYDEKIINFNGNYRELISDYSTVSKGDINYLIGLLNELTPPPFLDTRRFAYDIKNNFYLNRLTSILDLTIWFNNYLFLTK